MPLLPENPYLPIRGLNSDAQNLTTQEAECADIKNFRIMPKGLQTRGGTKRLAKNIPADGAILHFHTYKKPGGDNLLLAFSANNIYKYDEALTSWVPCLNAYLIDAVESQTGWLGEWSTSPGGYIGKSIKIEPFGSPHVIQTPQYAGIDLSGYTRISFRAYFPYDYANILTFVVEGLDTGASTIESQDLVAQIIDGSWVEITFDFATPANWTDFDRLKITYTYSLEPGTILLDYIVAYSPTGSDVTFWSTTDFLDNAEGQTVIAAGSVPPNPGQEESDQANRVLFYFDTTNEIFKPLITKQRTATTQESTGQTIAINTTRTGSTTNKSGSPLTFADMISEGTIVFYTREYGALGTASGIISTGNKYHLVVDDTSVLQGGGLSWIDKDGNYSLRFKGDVGDSAGLEIYVDYTWYETLNFYPRFVWSFYKRLLFGNTYEDFGSIGSVYLPWRIRWGQVEGKGDFDYFDYIDTVDIDPSPITGGDFQGLFLNITKERSIIKVFHVEGAIPQGFQSTTAAFNFLTVWKDGTFAGQTLCTFNNVQYFLGHDDVYSFDGNSRVSITRNNNNGQYRVRDSIFAQLNENKILNCFANIDTEHKEYWLWTVKTGETWPTTVWVYSILLDIWYKYEFSSVTALGWYNTQPATAIQDLVGNINEQNWDFLSSQLEGLIQSPIIAYEDGDVVVVDDSLVTDGGHFDPADGTTWIPGTPITGQMVTRDFIYQDLHRLDRTQKLTVECQGEDITVMVSNGFHTDESNFKQSQILSKIASSAEERNYYPDVVGRHVRFLLKFSGWTKIHWMQAYAIPSRFQNQ